MSVFDPQAFMSTPINDAFETEMKPVPECSELGKDSYVAVIDKVEPQQWSSRDGTKSGWKLRVTWVIQDPDVIKYVGTERPMVNQDIMLDLTESGALATGTGKNLALGRLRTAVKMNNPGKPFSLNQLVGQVAAVSVRHRTWEDSDGEIRVTPEVRGVHAV